MTRRTARDTEPHPVYFISSGPGDPGLLTLAGMRALQASKAVLAPQLFTVSFAEFLQGKEVESPFQMDHEELIGWIDARLVDGPVSFLIPGDFSTFCPFQSFAAHYRNNGDRAIVIPGVGAHAAAAALAGKTLDLPGIAYATVITSPRAYTRDGEVKLADLAGEGKTLVLYMNNLPLDVLVGQLLEVYKETTTIGIFERIGCEDQSATIATLADIEETVGDRDIFGVHTESPEPTLALVIVGESLGQDEPPKWWDHRSATIWKPRGVR